jgi:hypothetical protein
MECSGTSDHGLPLSVSIPVLSPNPVSRNGLAPQEHSAQSEVVVRKRGEKGSHLKTADDSRRSC